MGEQKNRFSELAKIDCSEYVEKKGNLSYLSWTWAWKKLMELYPDSYSTVYEDEGGRIYFTDGKTAWVKTGVTLVDDDYCKEFIEYLPVMDNRNNPIPVGQITSTAVNKAIQRSITKAIARHGLGLYIYSGEDLPEESAPEPAKQPDTAKDEAPQLICIACKKAITELRDNSGNVRTAQQVADYTYRESGAQMCWDCFRRWKNGENL